MNSTSSEAQSASPALRQRKLAAVVFTDVVGYSAMVQADEAASIERVRADLARMREVCAAHGGEWLQSMGDGLMLSFESAVAAVAFAAEVQDRFAERNAQVPGPERVQHRIGIHIGDVFRTPDGLIAGDGVNIAARLQTDAPAGGVCVSEPVRDLVRGKVSFDARFGGARSFKNIAGPIAVWHWHPRGDQPAVTRTRIRRRTFIAGGSLAAAAGVASGAFLLLKGLPRTGSTTPGPKSLAVLPFENLSDDKDAAYFADGIHEDLLTQLALLGDLKVVSRTSVMEYRNTTKKIPQIASELKVAALVEGSVRKAGNTVRVTAQLVDGQADKHIWAANYDRDLKDVFKVQTELAKEIAGSLNVSLTASEEQRISRAPTQNLQAYELYLRHQQLVRDGAGTFRSFTAMPERVELLEKAVALDPGFAIAWARLATDRARGADSGLLQGRDQQFALARDAMDKARRLAPDDPQVKIEDASLRLRALHDYTGAQRLCQEVLGNAPYNLDAIEVLFDSLWAQMRDGETVPLLERALSIDARNEQFMARLSNTYARFRRFDAALALRRALADAKPDDLDRQAGYYVFAHRATGRWEEYDRWRAGVPPGADKRLARLRFLDADRAIARRDFAEMHRLIDVRPEDYQAIARNSTDVDDTMAHALAWNAAGDRTRAESTSRTAVAKADAALRQDPNDPNFWAAKARCLAVLGAREQAVAAHSKSIECEARYFDAWGLEFRRRERAEMFALLGDAEKAIDELVQQSRLPGFAVHSLPSELELAGLWQRPRFLALLADPGANAPLAFDAQVQYVPKNAI